MDFNAEYFMLEAMRGYGNVFEQRLAAVLEVATVEQSRRIHFAMPDLRGRFGPGSDLFYQLAGRDGIF